MSTRTTRARRVVPSSAQTDVPPTKESKLVPAKRTRSSIKDEDDAQSKENTPLKNQSREQSRIDENWNVGTLVWTKMPKGSTIWPAQIVKPESPQQIKNAKASDEGCRFVKFVGTDSYAFVSVSDLANFGEGPQHEKFVKTSKAKKFKNAVVEASKLESSEDVRSKFNKKAKTMTKFSDKMKAHLSGTEVGSSTKSGKRGYSIVKSDNDDSTADTDTKVSTDEMDEADVSAYEQLRQENMRRNRAILESLELPLLPTEVSQPSAVRARGLGSKKKELEAAPTRQRSLRIQGKDCEGHELPANFRDPIRFKPGSDISGAEPERARRVGDISFLDSLFTEAKRAEKETADSLQEQLDAFVKTLREAPACDVVKDKRSGGLDYGNETAYKQSLSKLEVAEKDVAKVVPERIFSIAFHPTSLKPLVFAGDKTGRIGLFDPDGAEDDKCVTVFEVHSRPVTALHFDPRDHSKMYSSSYDNTARVLDLEKQTWVQVHESDEDQHGFLSTTYFDHTRDCLFGGFGKSPGILSMQDVRGGRTDWLELHHRTIRCIHVCPSDDNILMTGSIDGCVRLWDMRRLKSGCTSLYSLDHGKGVTAAYFNPTGKLAVTTCFDDTVRVIDVQARAEARSIAHNNQTGRWLTPFRACFDPKNSFAVAVGSMAQPRGIDVYNAETGRLVLRLQHANFGSITSLNCFHPTRNMLAGGNSSGKVLLWR